MTARHTYAGQPQHFNGSTEQNKPEAGAEGMLGQVRAAGNAVNSQAQHSIEDYPISTVLAVFGVGIGVGVALGTLMFAQHEETVAEKAQRFLPEGSSNWWPTSAQAAQWPANASHWFNSQNPGKWGENLMRGAKSMCGQ